MNDVSDQDMIAEPGEDYGHVSISLDPEYIAEYGITIPIVRDDKVEGPELFQINFYQLHDVFFAETPQRKRSATHPFDTRDPGDRDEYPCVRILIIDDDGKLSLYTLNLP